MFLFVIYLYLPSFAGDVEVEFRLNGRDACEQMRRVVHREMEAMTMRYTMSACMAERMEDW